MCSFRPLAAGSVETRQFGLTTTQMKSIQRSAQRWRDSGAVSKFLRPLLACAVGAAKKDAVLLYAVADHAATAMGTTGGKLMNGAFEAVEDVLLARHLDRNGFVILVAADFASSHGAVSSIGECGELPVTHPVPMNGGHGAKSVTMRRLCNRQGYNAQD